MSHKPLQDLFGKAHLDKLPEDDANYASLREAGLDGDLLERCRGAGMGWGAIFHALLRHGGVAGQEFLDQLLRALQAPPPDAARGAGDPREAGGAPPARGQEEPEPERPTAHPPGRRHKG